jgi:hypothetical protein
MTDGNDEQTFVGESDAGAEGEASNGAVVRDDYVGEIKDGESHDDAADRQSRLDYDWLDVTRWTETMNEWEGGF